MMLDFFELNSNPTGRISATAVQVLRHKDQLRRSRILREPGLLALLPHHLRNRLHERAALTRTCGSWQAGRPLRHRNKNRTDLVRDAGSSFLICNHAHAEVDKHTSISILKNDGANNGPIPNLSYYSRGIDPTTGEQPISGMRRRPNRCPACENRL